MTMTIAAPAPLSVGRALNRIVAAIRRRPLSVLVTALFAGGLPYIAYEFAYHWALPKMGGGSEIWERLLYSTSLGVGLGMLESIGSVAVILVATRAWDAEARGASPLAITVLSLTPLALMLEVVKQVAIALASVALLFPGLILTATWYVALPCLTLERKGVFGALGRSRALTNGNRWRVFGVLFVVGALGALAAIGIEFAMKPLYALLDIKAALVLRGVILGLLGGLQMLGPPAVYWELKQAREGPAVANVADIFA